MTILMLLAIVGIVVSTAGVYAYPVSVGESIKFQYAYGNADVGGAFGVYDNSTPAKFLFDTFCLETNEYINLGVYYHVGSISDVAIANFGNVLKGYQAAYGGDPLDSRTAYLFSKFATSALGFEHTALNANALQRAIWFIEQEYGNTQLVGGKYVGDWSNPALYLGGDSIGLKAQAFFEDAKLNAGGSLYGVQVLNVVDGNKQSMLVVPEPGILILLGIAMSAIGAASWRIRKL
jgi:hypothetical protein